MLADMTIEKTLRRDRLIVVIALTVVIVLSWGYILSGAGMGMSAFEMTAMNLSDDNSPGMAMMIPTKWTMGYVVLMFFMWWIMMIAMMLPSATPMILLHARVDRKAKEKSGEHGSPWPSAAFTLGYLLAWAGFSVIAAALQWLFEMLDWLSPMTMNTTNALLAGAILLFAGAWQLTPIKQACLRHCRGPVQFLSQNWRDGSSGALKMGLHHGTYCLGCCWGLMAILFFGGIMNLYWIIGLAIIVLLEKLLPLGPRVGQVIGTLLVIWGAGFLYQGLM